MLSRDAQRRIAATPSAADTPSLSAATAASAMPRARPREPMPSGNGRAQGPPILLDERPVGGNPRLDVGAQLLEFAVAQGVEDRSARARSQVLRQSLPVVV